MSKIITNKTSWKYELKGNTLIETRIKEITFSDLELKIFNQIKKQGVYKSRLKTDAEETALRNLRCYGIIKVVNGDWSLHEFTETIFSMM